MICLETTRETTAQINGRNVILRIDPATGYLWTRLKGTRTWEGPTTTAGLYETHVIRRVRAEKARRQTKPVRARRGTVRKGGDR